jgi:putative sigma-54 modulation protein
MGIIITGSIGCPIPLGYVGARMRRVLSRLPVHPVTAHITFRDVNGPKGGNDIRCAVLVELPRQPSIRIERLGRTPRLAFDASYDRVVRRLEQYRERRQDTRRHPKKYYVARRLL